MLKIIFMSFGGDFLKTELPSLSLLANGLFFMMSGCRFCRLPQYVHYPHEIRFHLKMFIFLSLAKQQCLIQCMAFSGCAAAPGPSWCSAGRPTRAPHGYVMCYHFPQVGEILNRRFLGSIICLMTDQESQQGELVLLTVTSSFLTYKRA